MTRRIANQAARGAFSLLELILVLAIVATLATIAAPRYASSLAAYRVESAGRRIVADLALARSMARTENRLVIVQFDSKNDKEFYSFVDEPDPDHPGRDYTVKLLAEPYRTRLNTVSFDGQSELGFDVYGTPVNDHGTPLLAAGTIVIESGGIQKTILVDQSSGKAGIQ